MAILPFLVKKSTSFRSAFPLLSSVPDTERNADVFMKCKDVGGSYVSSVYIIQVYVIRICYYVCIIHILYLYIYKTEESKTVLVGPAFVMQSVCLQSQTFLS